MQRKIIPLLLIAAALYAPPLHNNRVFSQESSTINFQNRSSDSNVPVTVERLFLSENVIWRVNRLNGTITALDPIQLTPLWTSCGVVYRARPTICSPNPLRDVSSTPTKPFSRLPLFDQSMDCAEISGRVYFHLAEKYDDDSILSRSNIPSPSKYTDQIIAFDPQAQGKLLWKLNANELKHILHLPSNVNLRFAAIPLKGEKNTLIVILFLNDQTLVLRIDASSGVPVLE